MTEADGLPYSPGSPRLQSSHLLFPGARSLPVRSRHRPCRSCSSRSGRRSGCRSPPPSPTWRDASVALAFLSGLFVLLTAVVSFGVGGYVAGRLRTRHAGAGPGEAELWDGVHGLLVWGLAVALGALLAALTASAALTRSLPGVGSPAAASAEPVIAYDLDRLLRTDRPVPDAETAYGRAEAGRIALAASGRRRLAPDDGAYLARPCPGGPACPRPRRSAGSRTSSPARPARSGRLAAARSSWDF